jgi:PPOX class probable F420-dependent enzyme
VKLTKAVADFVRWERVCRLATVSATGVPHLVPVCHVLADGKVYIGAGDDGTKVRNLRANPRATVTVDVYSDHWAGLKGVMLRGTASLIDRGPRFKRARRLLYAKYPQYATEAALTEADSVVIEVTPDHVFTWGFD